MEGNYGNVYDPGKLNYMYLFVNPLPLRVCVTSEGFSFITRWVEVMIIIDDVI